MFNHLISSKIKVCPIIHIRLNDELEMTFFKNVRVSHFETNHFVSLWLIEYQNKIWNLTLIDLKYVHAITLYTQYVQLVLELGTGKVKYAMNLKKLWHLC